VPVRRKRKKREGWKEKGRMYAFNLFLLLDIRNMPTYGLGLHREHFLSNFYSVALILYMIDFSCGISHFDIFQERIRIGKELLEAKKIEEQNERKRLVLSTVFFVFFYIFICLIARTISISLFAA
jgi:hypothetical protein